METKHLSYDCTHDHRNGHVMTLSWGHVLTLQVDFDAAKAAVIVKGETRNMFGIPEMRIDEFERKLEDLQDMADKLATFNTED